MLDQSNSSAKKAAPDTSDAPVVTDWEDVFEHADHGLIPLVSLARSLDTLKKCLLVIVESLFSRDSDAPFRDKYARKLEDMLPDDVQFIDGTNGGLEVIKKGVVKMLRQIKDYRAKKAAEALQKTAAERKKDAKGRKTEDSKDANLLLDMDAKVEDADAAKKPANDPESADAESVFTKMFCEEYDARLRILRKGVPQEPRGKTKLPFLLCEDFNVTLEAVIREYFIQSLIHKCRGLINKADGQDADKRKEFIRKYFTSKSGKSEVWGFWQVVWADVSELKELPEKPEPPKKKGLMSFAKKEKKRPAFMGKVLTEEEWVKECKKIEEHNAKAKRLWGTLCAEHKNYSPPIQDKDGRLLMELFGRSTNGSVNQMRAINQIVDQGVDLPRVFGDYQHGKSIEIVLLANCYQRPQIYLGEKGKLNEMMKGFRQGDFPLLSRYLPTYIRK